MRKRNCWIKILSNSIQFPWYFEKWIFKKALAHIQLWLYIQKQSNVCIALYIKVSPFGVLRSKIYLNYNNLNTCAYELFHPMQMFFKQSQKQIIPDYSLESGWIKFLLIIPQSTISFKVSTRKFNGKFLL